MSAFNTVTAEAICPVCGHRAIFEVQFKYGETWQHGYVLGDQLIWSGTAADRGAPGHRRVLVEGIGSQCPRCGSEDQPFLITVQGDRITAVEPAVGEAVPFGSEGYLVVDP